MAFDPIFVLSAILIVWSWSLLYKENVFYKATESVAIGFLMAYTLVENISILQSRIFVPLVIEGKWLSPTLLVTLLGLCYWLRPFRRTMWLSRWPISLMAGSSIGAGITGLLYADLIALVSMDNFFNPNIQEVGLPAGVNAIIIFAFTVCCLLYFVYTREHKGALGVAAKIGLYMLMIPFAWISGTFFMSSISFAVGSMQRLMSNTYGMAVAAISCIIILIDAARSR